MKLLAIIGGEEVHLHEDGSVSWLSGLSVDADGSPRAYGPPGMASLDYIANAGKAGNWWGLVTDTDGNPVQQGPSDPSPGHYVSTTSYEHRQFSRFDPRRYLNSEKVPYAVIPGTIARRLPGVLLGCRVHIEQLREGKTVEAVCGDIGPDTHLGEASIAAAQALGVDPDPKKGGSEAKEFSFTFYPGIAAPGYELQRLGS